MQQKCNKFLSFLLMLTAVVGLLSGTAHASETWSTNQTISSTRTIDGGVSVTANITLTIPAGVTLIVNNGITATGYTLTVSGDGKLNVSGSYGGYNGNGKNGGNGFVGDIIVNGAEVTVTGGEADYGYGVSGGTGGDGIYGNITINSGSITITGGKGGNGGDGNDNNEGGKGGDANDGGKGGNGIKGKVTVEGGVITITGGDAGYGGSGGRGSTGGKGGNGDAGGYGVSGNVTINSGSITITGGNGSTGGSGGNGSTGGSGGNGSNGGNGGNGDAGGYGVSGNVTINSGSITITGGNGGTGGSGGGGDDGNGGNGGNGDAGGYGVSGNVTINSGSITITGGNGGDGGIGGSGNPDYGGENGSGGEDGKGGDGIYGNVTINSGSITITGGKGGDVGYGGEGGTVGTAVTETITYSTGLTAQGKSDDSGWITIASGSNSEKRYVRTIIPVTLVSLDKTSITLTLGSNDTYTFTATVSPDNATYKTLTWTTSSKDVATVDENGKVTAVGEGTATITVTATNDTDAQEDDKTATCEVTVKAHHHSLSSYQLSADGTTITAVCANSDRLCDLPDATAKLIISAPEAAGGAASLSGDVEAFKVSASDITYAKKSGGTWGAESSTAPSGSGFFRASITAGGKTASVTYGVSAITINSGITNGTVRTPEVAAVGVVVPLTISPDIGYELDTLTPTKTSSGSAISVTTTTDGSKSFIMPDEEVTVSATFKLADYSIDISSAANGTVTAQKNGNTAATANYQETISLSFTPDTGYELDTVTVTDSNNNAVPVTDNTFTMPASAVTVSAVFKKIDYSIMIASMSNGTVTAQKNGTAVTTANYQDEISLSFTPAAGYELDTVTVTDSNDNAVTVTNNTFTMPTSAVTVNATFKMADYTIFFGVTSGSVTVPETANYQDTVRLIISPDAGYGVQSITITDGVTLNLVSKDTDTGVEIYEFSMPAGNISFDITFATTTIYTIFYKADSTITSVLYRFSSGDVGFKMKSDTKIGDAACWGGQMRGVVNKDSFPISFSVNNGDWKELDCEVVTDLGTSFNSLAEGNAVLVSGEASAFVASFKWGYYDTDENGNLQLRSDYGTKYYFVTADTTSLSVPNPKRRGYDFTGWSYKDKNDSAKTIDAGSSTTTVSIKDNIDKTTVFGAIWQHATSTVTYDLNGGNWSSSSNTASVSYGNTVTQPTDPTRNAYAFSGWTVKSRTRAMKGTQEVTLAAGSNFDFSTTKITEDITLQAAWKHVHSYAYIPLSNINSVIPGALPQEYIDKYGQYFHFKLCSLADDRCFEAHEYDKNGKCVCGAEKPSTEVTLEQTYGNRNATLVFRSKPQKNSPVTLSAPSTIGTDKFIKWEYRSLDSTTWHDLASHPAIGFVIPGSMRVNAVYRPLTSPDLTLTAERYGDDGLLFMMQYVLPKGWKATNAAVLYGDNHMVRYMEVVRSHTPVASLELTDPFLGIPIPGTQIDVGTFDEATYYYDREDNLLAVDGNKGVLRVNMLNGTAVNIPGYNEVTGKKAQSLGETSGYACGGLSGIKNENNGNRYIYVMGFVEYTDADNAKHLTAVGPIAVTYNSASSTITDTETYTYNY